MPSIAPASPDHVDVYLVLDDFGERLGHAWPQVDEERTDRETVVRDLLEGQYSGSVRMVAFITGEGWSLHVSEEIAGELALRIALEDSGTPAGLGGFLDRHVSVRPVQLTLPLRGSA